MQNPAPKKASAGRRLRRALWVGLGVMVGLPPLLLLGLRLYYNDARVGRLAQQTLQDRLHAPVQLGGLQLSLWDGVEILQLHVGPLPHFEHDTLHIERLAVHWQASAFLRGAVVLPEVALTGVRGALEENAQGSNVQAIAQALGGAAAQRKTEPPADSPPPTAPRPLRLPLPVQVDRLQVDIQEVLVDRPNQRATLHGLHASGHFAGAGEALETGLWFGLGDPNRPTDPSTLHWETDTPRQSLDLSQQLGVTLESTGFADLRSGVDWHAKAQVTQGSRTLLPMRLDAALRLEANLLGETVSIPQCQLSFGGPQQDSASLDLAAAVSHLFGTPEVSLQKLQGQVLLDALQGYLAPWLPDTHVGGVVRLRLAPLQASVPALRGWSTLATATEIDTEGVAYRRGDQEIAGVNSQTQIRTEAGGVQITSHVDVGRAAQGANRAQGLQLDLQAATPLAPWLGGAAVGEVPVNVQLQLARAQGPAYSASGTRLGVRLRAPVALLKRTPAGLPLQVSLTGSHSRVASGSNALEGLRYSAQAQAWDLAGQRANVELSVQARGATAQAMQVPQLAVRANLQRRDDTFEIRELRVSAARDWQFTLHGGIDRATSPAPHFRQLQARIAPLSLADAMALLPPGMRPNARLSGQFSAGFELQGTVPYQDYLASSHAPPLPAPDDPAWGNAMQDTIDWLQDWVDRAVDGLPFTASVHMEWVHVDFSDSLRSVQDLHLMQSLGLHKHGPAFSLDLVVPNVGGSTPMHGVKVHLDSTMEGDDIALRLDSQIAQIALAGQPTPLQDSRVSAEMDYRWGGDLRLRDAVLAAANRGVKLTADGLFAQPLDVAVSGAWKRTGMPGVEARLAWALGVHAPEQERLNQAGMTFSGALDMAGEVRLNAGVLALAGELRMDTVNLESGSTEIDKMNGTLPFDLRLVFGTRPEATVVHRDLPVGGGVLSLVTAEEDVRNRPARPVYYDRLRPYRPAAGLSALRIQSGPYEVVDFALEGRLVDGMLLADWIAMHVLGGDVVGNLALQLGRDSAVRGDMTFKVSNVDASYLPALKLHPGPESELSADMRVSLMAGAQGRDLSANMNVTKIGANALDRFLQLLDPEAKDAKLQDTRKNLRYVRIQEVALWLRYENLNMDLSYDPILAIPFTRIGYRPIERELLRRYALGEFLDLYLQPYIDTNLAPLLGWTPTHGRT